jgi:hypothetical protein
MNILCCGVTNLSAAEELTSKIQEVLKTMNSRL